MKYCLVVAFCSAELEVEVNKKIKNGWIPQGGITLAFDRGLREYCQAMICISKKVKDK